jgi:hypothetical protein
MTTDLEECLRADLAIDSECAELRAPEWHGVPIVAVAHGESPRWTSRSIGFAAALMLVAGTVVAIAARRDEPRAAGFVPPGTEVPLTDEFPRTEPSPSSIPTDWSVLAKPGSVHGASAPAIGGWLVKFDSVDYDETSGTVSARQCLAMADVEAVVGLVCSPSGDPSPAGSGGDSSGKRTQWVSVPSGASAVGYVDGAGKFWWQRPIDQMVIFPRVESDGTFTAYADDGTVLQVFDTATNFGGVVRANSQEDSLTLAQRRDLHDLIREQMRNCVDSYGATYPNGLMFPVLPVDVDPGAWDACVAQAKTVVDQRFAALGGRLTSTNPVINESVDSSP